jgi:NAD(P)-dependent dehydrogenase (short-subunit alcohol dehydrogenase family)
MLAALADWSIATMSNVLITGTSSGFGFLTAKALLNHGHTVFATMREPETRNAPAVAALRDAAQSSKGTLHVLELDVTDERSVEQAVKQAVETAGHLDVIVNNAGILTGQLAETYTTDDLRSLFDINLFGVHRVCRAALPHMRERKQGLVINVSSSLGRYILPYVGPYAATKFALEGYSSVLAVELAPVGVQVVVVEPGAFMTGVFTRILNPSDQDRVASYGELGEAPGKMWEQFGQTLAAQGPDPQLIADKITELIEMPAAERPARAVVDMMLGQFTEAINAAVGEAQAGVFATLQGG